ncbi:MAG: hypothetical protein H0W42_12210 [Gemmatimonadaceae bacterium]|nr:hypothetical protein [Gemmatimonadaceae bacterium]
MVLEFARDVFVPLGQAGADAFDDTRSWVDPRGYRLSDRLWNARKADRDAIDRILREAIVAGDDPLAAARRLEDYLLPSARPVRDPRTGRLVRWKRDELGNLLRDSGGRLISAQPIGAITRTPRSGAGSYAARRLARTETTRAFGQATMQAAALNPFVSGVKWNLSGSHPEPDECDSNARRSSQGLPRGVYRSGDEPRYPNHPNELCYLSPYVAEDTDAVIDQLRRDFDIDPQPVRLFGLPAGGRARELVTTLFRAARQFLTKEAA